MGNVKSIDTNIRDNPNREVFVVYVSHKNVKSRLVGYYISYTFNVRYQRYSWEIHIRFNELIALDRRLLREYPEILSPINRPSKHSKMFWTHDQKFILERAKVMCKYLQDLLDAVVLFNKVEYFRQFMNVSRISFNPDLGRKGKEGYLIKCSGGYVEKFSRKTGDYFNMWSWRYFVISDNCITWYASPTDPKVLGTLQIDQSFHFVAVDRIISIYTATRKLVVQAWTKRLADEWIAELRKFYVNVPRTSPQHFLSTYPPRMHCEAKVYTVTRDYMAAAAIAMLGAQKEILITSWKNSPGVLLTRPPFPPLRLDQILKHKAEQGVKIFILLYKEVEYTGQGNDSLRTKTHLESLNANIRVIRHPNKYFGGSTAVLWSHHEKTVVVDRNVAFVGGVDLAFQRWDDEDHRVADENGLHLPGHDYRQPATGLFKPARVAPPPSAKEANGKKGGDLDDDDEIEVEIAMPGESLPEAMTSAIGTDEQPYEVEVVVDFGVQSSVTTWHQPPPTSPTAEERQTLQANNNTSAPPNLFAESGAVGSEAPDDQSEAMDEHRYAVETPAEIEAKRQAELQEQPRATDNGEGSSFYRSTMSTVSEGFRQTRSTLGQTLDYFASQFQNYKEQVISLKRTTKDANALEDREMYPRMPWHDVQAVVSGAAARDVACHFVQRWNHHRLSTASHNSEPLMYDICDDFYFGVCARCEEKNLNELLTHCPKCNYYLGPINTFSQPRDLLKCPENPETFSYVVFECRYFSSLPFRMQGDCPVVVTALLQSACVEDGSTEGRLVDLNGPMAQWLHAFGLVPAVGDVILAVDGDVVTQLNSNQFKRLIKRKRAANRAAAANNAGNSSYGYAESLPYISVTFRRHYLENMHPVDKKFETQRQADDYVNSMLDSPEPVQATAAPEEGVARSGTPSRSSISQSRTSIAQPRSSLGLAAQATSAVAADGSAASAASAPPSMSVDAGAGDAVSVPAFASAPMTEGGDSFPILLEEEFDLHTAEAAVPVRDEGAVLNKNVDASGAVAPEEPQAVAAQPLNVSMLHLPVPNAGSENRKKVAEFHPACKAAAFQELKLAMGQLFHQHARNFDSVSPLHDESGTCKVQVLRSVGKWAVGTKTENSIYNCWVETIQGAQRFIYIENQFFIGNNAGDGVANGIPAAIVERILAAHAVREAFKVIIIIPIHPNGDYAGAMKAKVVMHYQYQTINRGLNSMFATLKKRAPDITISDYLGFYSLRNWGVINNKVVSDQIYVHDKLLIVDDRIIVIGSANINDRSMLGCRDTEMALRIEDTLHLDITMNGHCHTVGYLPHTLRLRLMKQHVKDDSIDFSDPLKPAAYDMWKYIANKNSSIYDELDGNLSVYRCQSLSDHHAAFGQYVAKSILDPIVKESVSEIKGYLVDWPQNLFKNEDLSPSMATRAIVPNELWY